ncbi:hypothetical protein MNB_SV-5-1531 [hydrothermal vent metagenome]|uniref:YbbD head domain-containing protein n=1 Tax=hydrothermal vent metagenome TaxID=652676 RepID=A0A1W1EEW2_9ZZZZ
MKKHIKWPYILIFVLSLLTLAYVGFMQRYSDVQINKYEDKSIVVENKAIEKGWVPSILPDSAYDITETHDIDTNTILGVFLYKDIDEDKFMQNLTQFNDTNDTLQWENFIFKVDKKINKVQFRNKPKEG